MAERLSMRAYGRHRKRRGLRGTSHTAVSNAIKDGRIADAVGPDGLIDADQADELWEAHTRPVLDDGPAPGAENGKPGSADEGGGTADSPEKRKYAELYHKSRAKHEAAKAAERELELRRKQGELIPAELYRRQLSAFLTRLRSIADSIPPSWAPRLAACGGDPEEIHIELEQLVADEVLTPFVEDLDDEEDQEEEGSSETRDEGGDEHGDAS